MVFIFQSVYMVDYIYLFAYVEPSLLLWDETYLIIVMGDLLNVLLDLAYKYFIYFFTSFASVFIREISLYFSFLSFFFFVGSLCGFGIRVTLGS